MRSCSRNSREKTSWQGLAVATACLLLGSGAQAGEHNFVLTAYTDGRGGRALISGDYAAAGKALGFKPTLAAFDTSTNSNNRCVSLTVTKQWDAARGACDKAVSDAERERTTLPATQSWAQSVEDNYVAVALSNRAVLHWMADESDAAAADLERAAALSPKSAFVQRNKSALEFSHRQLARADVASK
jgi:hypothetical protein